MYFDVMVVSYERKYSETYTVSPSLQDQPIPYSGHQHAYQHRHCTKKVKTLLKNRLKFLFKFTLKISSHRNNINIFIDTEISLCELPVHGYEIILLASIFLFFSISVVRLRVFLCIIPPSKYMNTNIKHDPPFCIRPIPECKTCRGRGSAQQPHEIKM